MLDDQRMAQNNRQEIREDVVEVYSRTSIDAVHQQGRTRSDWATFSALVERLQSSDRSFIDQKNLRWRAIVSTIARGSTVAVRLDNSDEFKTARSGPFAVRFER